MPDTPVLEAIRATLIPLKGGPTRTDVDSWKLRSEGQGGLFRDRLVRAAFGHQGENLGSAELEPFDRIVAADAREHRRDDLGIEHVRLGRSSHRRRFRRLSRSAQDGAASPSR